MTDVVNALLRANIVAALAIALVIAIRLPARRVLGVEMAYTLWVLPVVAVVATLAPARRFLPFDAAPAGLAAPVPNLALLWLGGALLLTAWFAGLQIYYARLARRGRAGPAVIGMITPRLHMPPDDGAFTRTERDLIRAHEREHILRGDPIANAVAAAIQCACWFNPLVHLGVRLMREDQELACDAGTLRRHGPSRAAYARALLKAQTQAHALPLGASWAAGPAHPLEVRVAMLSRRTPPGAVFAPLLIFALGLGGALAVWYAQPPARALTALEFPPAISVVLLIALFCTLSWKRS